MGASFSDNFNRADNTDLGANWTPNPALSLVAGLQIVSNRVRSNEGVTAAGGWEYVTGTSFANDQLASVTLYNNAAHDSYGGVTVRLDTTVNTSYYLTGDNTGGYSLGKVITGSFTTLGSDATNIVSGDIVQLTVVVKQLVATKNGIGYLSTNDAAIASGSPGVVAGWNPGGADGDVELDNYSAADYIPIIRHPHPS